MKGWREFTENEQIILDDCCVELDEFYYEDRKGTAQTKYVFEVKAGTWRDWRLEDEDCMVNIPDDLVGTWMMAYAEDLSYDNLRECIKLYPWVKCHKVEKTVEVWEEV